MMIMIRAIVRPEKSDDVLAALMDAGFPAVTKYSVTGRGKQRGIKIGEVTYDEIPKTMLVSVVKADDKDFVINTIMDAARSGKKGAFCDGKIFVTDIARFKYAFSMSRRLDAIPERPEWVSAMEPGHWYGISGDSPDLALPCTPVGTRYLQDNDPARDSGLNPPRSLQAIKVPRGYVESKE